jgi:glyoxylase-like metal-dependent hydrolase (beta-lactamase superfamily II)
VSALGHAKLIAPTGAVRTRFGETPLYAEGLWDLGRGVYAWMVPNGSWGEANAGLVVGHGASMLVDTLWDERLTRAMLAAMAGVTRGAPIATVVNTHADGDHWFGNALLPDAEIVTSAAARAHMHARDPRAMLAFARLGRVLHGLPLPGMRRIGAYFAGMAAPYDFVGVRPRLPARSFSGAVDLEVGGRRVRLIEVGPEVLFAGDVLFRGSTPVMWAGPPANWLQALDRIESLDVDVVVPGHGPLTDRSGAAPVRAYWRLVERAAREQFGAGVSASKAARTILASDGFMSSPFATWDSPERILTSVHTLYRHWRGRTRPLSMPEVVLVLARQALLACELAGARPAVMHAGA